MSDTVAVVHHADTGTPEHEWVVRPEWGSVRTLTLDGSDITRLVLVAAHPDDETLGAGGLLATAAAADLPIDVVLLSAGEASHPDSPTHAPGELATLRVEETRVALALLDDAFDGHAMLDGLRVFEDVPVQHLGVVRQMIASRLNAPLAHGAGRYFDAIAALALAHPSSGYEGQLALQWNTIADDSAQQYGFAINQRTTPWEIDLRAMVRDIVADLISSDGVALFASDPDEIVP